MTLCNNHGSLIGWAIRCTLLGLVAGAISGCGGGEGAAVQNGDQGNSTNKSTSARTKSSITASNAIDMKVRPVVYQPARDESFREAVVLDPPRNQARPPDLTRGGKSVGKLYQQVAGINGKGGLWNSVPFTSKNGKRLAYSATIITDAGEMQMELWPSLAPNHVRNFVALARAGYYDGLQFDRAAREVDVDLEGKYHDFIEAGCPLGTGETNYGSIGYWLKPEISNVVKHEPGIVGAARGLEMDSAACKFYVTLNQADCVDGQYTIFGKITSGLDVAQKIFNRPKVEGLPDRPQNPVPIRQVIIHTQEREPASWK